MCPFQASSQLVLGDLASWPAQRCIEGVLSTVHECGQSWNTDRETHRGEQQQDGGQRVARIPEEQQLHNAQRHDQHGKEVRCPHIWPAHTWEYMYEVKSIRGDSKCVHNQGWRVEGGL